MSINENKILTDMELIDIVKRAPDEIECADAYRHFMEDLAELCTTHFGGDVGHVNGPVEANQHELHCRCDNCQKEYVVYVNGETGENGEFKPLGNCRHLVERLTPGSPVPDGECTDCGAFVYAERDIDSCWVASIKHNECVPLNGWVYNEYDPDINWNQQEEEPS